MPLLFDWAMGALTPVSEILAVSGPVAHIAEQRFGVNRLVRAITEIDKQLRHSRLKRLAFAITTDDAIDRLNVLLAKRVGRWNAIFDINLGAHMCVRTSLFGWQSALVVERRSKPPNFLTHAGRPTCGISALQRTARRRRLRTAAGDKSATRPRFAMFRRW